MSHIASGFDTLIQNVFVVIISDKYYFIRKENVCSTLLQTKLNYAKRFTFVMPAKQLKRKTTKAAMNVSSFNYQI